MSLTLLTYPADTCSVSNEMLFVIQEATKAVDPVTYPNYKYVLDVYVASALVARMKVNPDPVNSFGIFDVSKILQNYATYGFADPGVTVADYSIKVDYQVKLGEEYSDTLYTNLVVDSARSCFQTYKEKPFTSSVAIPNGLASNMPTTTNQHGVNLHNIFNVCYNATGVTDISIVFKNEGTTVHTTSVSMADYLTVNKMRRINIGTLIATWANASTHVLITGDNISQRINILCSSKYTPYTLVWLNPFGAYESQSFGLVSKKTIDVDKKYYTKLDYEINASGVVSYKADNVFYGGKRGYASKVKTKLSLTSHLLSDGEYTWFADLFASPDVYFFDGTNFIPVSITETNYEHRTYLNSKVTPLQFSIEFGTDYNTQLL